MAYAMQELLSYVPLMKSIESVKTGIPNIYPPEFWTTIEEVPGDRATVVLMPGTRQVARVAAYGSPAREVSHVKLGKKDVVILWSAEELKFGQELLNVLRQWERYEPQQKFAKDEIARQGIQFAARQDNLERATLNSFIAQGIAWYDVNGNILPSSSGAVLTVDQNIPANNKNQLNGIISASWATTTTNIVAQINALKQRTAQQTGYQLKYAFYGINIPNYFAANDSIKLFWQYNNAFNTRYLESGLMPPEMLGLIWIPAFHSFFEDPTGTNQTQFPADGVTFLPEINTATYALLKGSTLIPSQFGAVADAEAALATAMEVYGRFRYAYMSMNPYGIHDIMGNCFMPFFKVPEAVYIADVTP